MQKLIKLFITVLTAATTTACFTADGAAAKSEASSPANVLARDINKLSLDLYGKMTADGENTFFSPLSISTAFGLASQGAAGATATEMHDALRLSMPFQDVATTYNNLMKSLNEREGDFKLNMANALWLKEGFGIKDSYLAMARQQFQARVAGINFNTPETAAGVINKWVAGKTAGKIKELIPASAITPLTRLILTNAVYFKGTWQRQFQKQSTKLENFYLLDGKTVKTETMHQTERFGYKEADGVKALKMPYKKCGLAMIVLLPEKKDGLPELEKALDTALLDELTSGFSTGRVRLALPKLKLETKYSLNSTMQALGMARAFDVTKADFSGITDQEQLFIQAAIHKAYVKVDEKGTEAAAATGVMIKATSASVHPPIPFIADHPFLFLIKDTRTGVILFMGRVLDPRQ